MPQLQSFSNWASAPGGDTWSSGAAIGQRIGETAINAQLERQKLAQQAQEASMRNSIAKQQLQMESMRAAQELEVKKSYEQQMFQLKQSEMNQAQQEIDAKAAEAARQAQAQAVYQQELSRLMSSDIPLPEATSQAAAKGGLAMGQGAGGVMEAVIRSQADRQAAVPTVLSLKDEQGNPTSTRVFRSGSSFIRAEPELQQPQGPPPGKLVWRDERGNATLTEDTTWTDYEKQIDIVRKELNGPVYEIGKLAKASALDGKEKLTPNRAKYLAMYTAKLEELEGIKQKFEQYKQSRTQTPPTPFAPGAAAAAPAGTNKIVIRAIRPAQR